MSSEVLSIVIEYFRQFSTTEGLRKLLTAMLVMTSSFFLNGRHIHPCSNSQVALALASGLGPFFLITIIPKLRYSIPPSFITITLFYAMFRNMPP